MESYLKKIGRSDLIKTKKVSFIFNAFSLKFGDKTKIENYFRYTIDPIPILVSELGI